MIDTNAILLCDTYKTCHNRMFPEGLTKLYSYWVPRKSMLKNHDKMVFFGIQAFIQEYLVEYFNDNFFNKSPEWIYDTFTKYLNIQLGKGNYEVKPIIDLHHLGYLPLEIKALPEGSKVNMGVPCIELTNTHHDFAWVVQWIECLLQAELWKTCNHATIGNMYYELAKEWYDKTVENGDPRMAFADFGMRGMSCMNEAVRCSAAWLLSSNKTSSVCALPYLDTYYDANCEKNRIGLGAVSTEHSVIGANKAVGCNEKEFLKKMLTEIYSTTSFSFLGDTYDYWNFVENIVPECKEEILKHRGTLFVRPDSGDMVEITLKTIQLFWNQFGGTVNSKGYKLLDSHIRLIYGDGCTLQNLKIIWTELEKMGFAANNVIFGIGAFCFSAVVEDNRIYVNTRDLFGVAMKATAGIVDNKFIKIYKDPKTDSSLKKSHKGLVYVTRTGDDFEFLDDLDDVQYDRISMERPNYMRTVFKNGETYNRETFIDIRNRLASQN